MKKILGLLLALCLLAGAALSEEAPSLGKPYVNPNLLYAFPERPRPEENYYLYANFDSFARVIETGDYFQATQRGQTYQVLTKSMADIGRNTEYTDPESQIIRILYGLAMDSEKREQDGITPLMSRIERLRAVTTTEELTALLQEDGFLLSLPFLYCKTQKAMASDRYVVMIQKASPLDAPELQPDMAEEDLTPGVIRNLEKPRRVLLLLQYSEEEADRLLPEIVRYTDEPVVNAEVPEWLDAQSVSLAAVRENCPLLYTLFTAWGLVKEGAETQPLYEIEPISLISFLDWYTDENLETLKAMVALYLYKDATIVTDAELYRGSSLYGAAKTAENRAFDTIKTIAQVPTNQAYVTHYCPDRIWRTATDLFEETREAMRARISASPWMNAESKQRAMAKLNDLTMGQIVPPGGNFDCGPLLKELRGCDTLMDAAALCIRFDRRCLMRFTGEALLRENPYTGLGVLAVGGAYLPDQNMFFIGAPALSEGLCDYSSRETLLGSLGTHIGHELSHGYDSLGARYDTGSGPLFTEEDDAFFTKETKALAAVMDRIDGGNGQMLKGEVQVYETMADLTGMTLMLDLAKREENFDYDAFFRAFAAFHFDYSRGEDGGPEEGSGAINPHAPYHVRVNFTLAHFDEFYETYPAVTEGTPMYLAPEDRILVW